MAARDVIIALKTQIVKFFDLIVKKEVAAALSPDVLKEIIVRLVTQCYKQSDFELEILLSEKDKQNLRKLLEKDLQDEIRKGITFYPSPSVKKGFRIGEKDKNLYYDFTEDAIAETLNFYLNKKVKEIIDLGLKENSVQ
ncbi:MAG: hypothetical protein DRP08_07430 [Candidatus Aenigmatarchaeota archaeon]|nr:MAG: hypothetical protein DRP08_07430 [Candidatus Aenigmarchaeota archaeon]